MSPHGAGSGSCAGSGRGSVSLAVEQLGHHVDGVVGQRVGVLPALPEHGLGVPDRGSADRHLDVVPSGPRAVHRGHRKRLRVAAVLDVVAPAVAQVDAADEGDVVLGPVAVAQHHQLLVVRAEAADPHVEQALAARLVDRLAELAVLLRR